MCLCKGNLGAWRTLHYQATTRHAAVSLTWYIPSLKRPAKGLCLLRKLHSRQTTLQRDKPITTLNLIPQYLNVNPASLLLCPFSLSIDSKVENSHLSSILPCSVGYILDSHVSTLPVANRSTNTILTSSPAVYLLRRPGKDFA